MKIRKEIFALAIPNIISNISVPLIASVDTGLMGHLSTNHLAAVGIVAMIFNFLYWNFGFLRMGTTGLVAQAHGKQDNLAKAKAFWQATLLALVISSLIVLIQVPFARISMEWMNLESDLIPLAKEYFFVRIWDAPATLFLYIAMAWFFGNQNSVIPLILTVIINICNIAISVYFVKYLDMGIAGVAAGSVIANYIGVFAAVIFMYTKLPVMRINLQNLGSGFSRFLQLNKDIFLRTVLLSITFAFMYSMAAKYGAIILAVHVIILQFTNWMSYAVDGFAYASEALVGKYVGAKMDDKTYETIKQSFIYGGLFALLFAIAYGIFAEPLTRIFTSEHEVVDQLLNYRWWIVAIPIVGFASYIWDGVFIGLTASKAMRNTMFISFVFFISTYYLFEPMYGYTGLLLALCVYLGSRGIAQYLVFRKDGLALD